MHTIIFSLTLAMTLSLGTLACVCSDNQPSVLWTQSVHLAGEGSPKEGLMEEVMRGAAG